MIPLIFIIVGYLATSLSKEKRWWFGAFLGITSFLAFILFINLYDYYYQGEYFFVLNTGAFSTAAIMTGMSALGGLVYKMKNKTP
jgi:hypothetical protein